MCGISAIIHFDGKPAEATIIEEMNAVAHHRGPDGAGVLCEGAVGLGHTRLSIIDVTERANQPMARGGHFLSYNGEIYNYIELRDTLEAKGHRFVTTSDTEVLLAALIEWGREALDRLNGMFAFVYFDVLQGKLWAVRDRFGIKPLVFTRVGNMILFASEAKQILATKSITPKLNQGVATSFLKDASLNAGRQTFFSGIEEIQAGEMAIVSLGSRSISVERWYKLEDKVAVKEIPYEVARDHVRMLLDRSIARHFRSDVPIGASLSGGIDSSVIVTVSSTLKNKERIKALSAYSCIDGYNETKYSRVISQNVNAEIIEFEVNLDNIWNCDFLQDQGYFQDQPILGGSQYNEYNLFREASRNNLVVMLDGQGSDEYFGGYGEFWFSAQCEALRGCRIGRFLSGINANSATVGRPFNKELINFFSNFYREKKGASPCDRLFPPWLRESSAGRSAPEMAKNFLDLSIEKITKTSIPWQLHSQDRNAMRWSVESRVPFLDHELVEFVLGLPTHYKVGGGYRKRILRDSVPELPRLIAERKDKIGFASPDEVALRRNPKPVRAQLGAAARSFPALIDGEVLLREFDSMISAGRSYDSVFYRVLALEGWRKAHGVST